MGSAGEHVFILIALNKKKKKIWTHEDRWKPHGAKAVKYQAAMFPLVWMCKILTGWLQNESFPNIMTPEFQRQSVRRASGSGIHHHLRGKKRQRIYFWQVLKREAEVQHSAGCTAPEPRQNIWFPFQNENQKKQQENLSLNGGLHVK